jgi:hypothetical protein
MASVSSDRRAQDFAGFQALGLRWTVDPLGLRTDTHSPDPSAEGEKQASAEADRAMAWFQKAVAAGWSNVTQMEADHDLDAIRDRADFKALLGKLKSRKNDDTAR